MLTWLEVQVGLAHGWLSVEAAVTWAEQLVVHGSDHADELELASILAAAHTYVDEIVSRLVAATRAEGDRAAARTTWQRLLRAWSLDGHLPPRAWQPAALQQHATRPRGQPIAMFDLGPAVRAAVARADGWTHAAVASTLARVAALIPGTTSDWEAGDEECARVLGADEEVALLFARLPLGFVLAGRVDVDSLPEAVVWIPVATFHAADYALNPHLIEQLAGRPVGDGLVCTHLSIHELWFATV